MHPAMIVHDFKKATWTATNSGIIAAAIAVIVLLWTNWADVADLRQEVAKIHKALTDMQANIRGGLADQRTEMIRETSHNREDTTKLGARINVLEAATEQASPQP